MTDPDPLTAKDELRARMLKIVQDKGYSRQRLESRQRVEETTIAVLWTSMLLSVAAALVDGPRWLRATVFLLLITKLESTGLVAYTDEIDRLDRLDRIPRRQPGSPSRHGADVTAAVTFEPSSNSLGVTAGTWRWEDLTEGELRCLWVLEQHLAEFDRRFYHLDRDLTPRRLGHDQIIVQAIPGGIDSWDGTGLASLTCAAFAAGVRVSVSATHAYYDTEMEESPWYWHEDEVEAGSDRIWVDNHGGRYSLSYPGLPDPVESDREPRDVWETFEFEADRDARLMTLTDRIGEVVEPHDAPGTEIGVVAIQTIQLSARSHTGKSSMFDYHPDPSYLMGVLDSMWAPPVPTSRFRRWALRRLNARPNTGDHHAR